MKAQAITQTPETVQTFTVPPHICRDESVRELEGHRFTGWRCRYCLRPTAGPSGGLVATDLEVTA
jgi:hypothetical protein